MIRAVIFDIDGTLVDSNDFHVEAWRRAFERYGKHLMREAIHAQIGKGGDQLMPVFLAPQELERYGAELDRYRGELFLREFVPRVRPFPGVRPLFERIVNDGMRIVLASSAKAEEVERHLRSLQVADLVESTTSADDVEHSKPCPDIFQAALAKLEGVEPGTALVVGDTPYDVKAAARAGMATIAVLSGGFAEPELRASGAIAVYRDIAELHAGYDHSPLARGAKAKTATG